MWTLLISLVTSLFSSPLSSVTKELANAYTAKINAANDAERLAQEERIANLEARKSIILAAQSDPFERWIRIAIAIPFIFFINKVVLWDTVLGWGYTNNLSATMTNIMMLIIGGYFMESAIKKIKS